MVGGFKVILVVETMFCYLLFNVIESHSTGTELWIMEAGGRILYWIRGLLKVSHIQYSRAYILSSSNLAITICIRNLYMKNVNRPSALDILILSLSLSDFFYLLNWRASCFYCDFFNLFLS